VASIVVPFAANDEIDIDLLRKEALLLDRAPVHALSVGGMLSGTEGASAQELALICETVRRSSRKPLFATAFPDTRPEAIEMVRAVTGAGASAVLVAQPHYLCQPDEEGLVAQFSDLRQATKVPLLLADCFPTAVVGLKATTRLLREKLIDGVLQAADAHVLVDLLYSLKGVPIYSGIEDLHYIGLLLGAHGLISDLGAGFPADLADLYAAFQQGEHERARFHHDRLVRFWRILNNPAEREARLRVAITAQGRAVGGPRSPYNVLGPHADREVREVLGREGIALV
jgi:4-hydroxy-tetrahydrodipicolinate synthase